MSEVDLESGVVEDIVEAMTASHCGEHIPENYEDEYAEIVAAHIAEQPGLHVPVIRSLGKVTRMDGRRRRHFGK